MAKLTTELRGRYGIFMAGKLLANVAPSIDARYPRGDIVAARVFEASSFAAW